MKKPLSFDDLIQPISLPTTSVQGGENAILMVWGGSKETVDSDILRHAEFRFIPRDDCEEWYGDSIKDGMLCTGHKEGGRDTCQGDSGNPLLYQSQVVCLRTYRNRGEWVAQKLKSHKSIPML